MNLKSNDKLVAKINEYLRKNLYKILNKRSLEI